MNIVAVKVICFALTTATAKKTPNLYAIRAMKMSILFDEYGWKSKRTWSEKLYLFLESVLLPNERARATDWCFDDGKGCAMWWWSYVCKIVNTIFKMVIIDLTVCSIATHINNNNNNKGDERNENFYGGKNENSSDFNCVEYEKCIFLLISFSHRKTNCDAFECIFFVTAINN